MDIVILKIEQLSFFLPGLTRKSKSVDSIVDINRSNFYDASRVLEKICSEVAHHCTERHLTQDLKNVRANIFLPVSDSSHRGHTFVLKMPHELRVNMDNPQENEIYFYVSQGSVGEAYETGREMITRQRNHRIPEYLADKLDARLKWWASFPIRESDNYIIGVLSVDGLDFELPPNEEANIQNIVRIHLREISKELDKQPRQDIFVVQKIRKRPRRRKEYL